jgi:Na+/melibiose symporter-like transporter
MRRGPVDLIAIMSSALAALMVIFYVWLIRQEPDQPVWWFVATLTVGALLAAYGAFLAAPWRRPALGVSALVLLVLGILGIFSIGVPILVAGVLSMLAASRPVRVAA